MERATLLVLVCLLQVTVWARSIEASTEMIKRIDTHCHLVPPFYAELLQEHNIVAGGRAIPSWSATEHLEVMDLLNVSMSIVAVSTPAAVLMRNYQVKDSRQLARRLNEYAYNLSMEYPQRFSFFATLTLPDVEGSVAEAIYALDTLNAAGVMILATSSDELLGSPRFEPLYAELDKRNATVFVHPSQSPCPVQDTFDPILPLPDIEKPAAEDIYALDSANAGGVRILASSPEDLLRSPLFDKLEATESKNPSLSLCGGKDAFDKGSSGLPPYAVDFLLDTTRAAVNLIFRNMTRKYPNVKYIFAHSGGFLPFSTFRIVRILMMLTKQTEEAIVAQLQAFYVDTALSASKYALPSTISLLGTSHLTFGSDYPFAPPDAYVPNTENLDQFVRDTLTPDDGQQINLKTASELFSHILSDDILATMGFG